MRTRFCATSSLLPALITAVLQVDTYDEPLPAPLVSAQPRCRIQLAIGSETDALGAGACGSREGSLRNGYRWGVPALLDGEQRSIDALTRLCGGRSPDQERSGCFRVIYDP